MTESRSDSRRTIRVSVALCTLCVLYFLVLDRAVFSSTNFSRIFRYLLEPDAKTAWVMLVACIVAGLWKRPAPILKIVEFLGRRPRETALLCVASFAVLATTVYHNYPLSMDEYAAVFQAKIFAAGQVSAVLPHAYLDWLVVRGFNGEFLVASHETGRIIEEYWPGFALLLAPFEFLRIPWLCNSALSGVALYLIYWITKEISKDNRAAGWALLFTLASGVFVADGISYYSMQAHLTANLLFAALLIRPSRFRAAAAGLVGSLALVLHNPVPHTLFAIPWLLAMIIDRQQWRYVAPLVLGYLPGLCIGILWLLYRSDIGAAAHNLSTLKGMTNGVFTWPNATVLNMRAASLVKMWLWAAPGLFVLAILGGWRRRENRHVRLLAVSAIFTLVEYLFVTFDQGHGWGYRYFHSAWGVIPILAACALTQEGAANPRLGCFAGACAILGLLTILPLQMAQIEGFVSQHLAQLGTPRRPGNNVYFIRPGNGFYVADMAQIDPFLRDPDLLLVSRGKELDASMVLHNWPDAVKIGDAGTYEQWYLGPKDHRREIPGIINSRQFVLLASP
jgi:hypothetical protein